MNRPNATGGGMVHDHVAMTPHLHGAAKAGVESSAVAVSAARNSFISISTSGRLDAESGEREDIQGGTKRKTKEERVHGEHL